MEIKIRHSKIYPEELILLQSFRTAFCRELSPDFSAEERIDGSPLRSEHGMGVWSPSFILMAKCKAQYFTPWPVSNPGAVFLRARTVQRGKLISLRVEISLDFFLM